MDAAHDTLYAAANIVSRQVTLYAAGDVVNKQQNQVAAQQPNSSQHPIYTASLLLLSLLSKAAAPSSNSSS